MLSVRILFGCLRVLRPSPPELVHEIEMHQMEVHADTKQEQSHPDKDEWQEDSVHSTRNTIEIVGKSPNERKEKGSEDDPKTRLHEP